MGIIIVQDIKQNEYKVIYFSSKKCIPCKRFNPFFEDLNSSYKSMIDFQKIDIDENMDMVSKYDIDILPTIIILERDKILEKIVGSPPNFLKFEKKIRNLIK